MQIIQITSARSTTDGLGPATFPAFPKACHHNIAVTLRSLCGDSQKENPLLRLTTLSTYTSTTEVETKNCRVAQINFRQQFFDATGHYLPFATEQTRYG
jgi:hypothetical protein